MFSIESRSLGGMPYHSYRISWTARCFCDAPAPKIRLENQSNLLHYHWIYLFVVFWLSGFINFITRHQCTAHTGNTKNAHFFFPRYVLATAPPQSIVQLSLIPWTSVPSCYFCRAFRLYSLPRQPSNSSANLPIGEGKCLKLFVNSFCLLRNKLHTSFSDLSLKSQMIKFPALPVEWCMRYSKSSVIHPHATECITRKQMPPSASYGGYIRDPQSADSNVVASMHHLLILI